MKSSLKCKIRGFFLPSYFLLDGKTSTADSVWIIGLFCFIAGCLCCLCWLRFAPHDKQRQLLNPVCLSHEYSYNIMGFSLFWSHENSHGLRTKHSNLKWGTRLSWLSIYLCIYFCIYLIYKKKIFQLFILFIYWNIHFILFVFTGIWSPYFFA